VDERAAFTFTRKLTLDPHKIADRDIAALRQHYKDVQIVEIIVTVCGNNAMTRWTDALGIPQEDYRVYLTPTSQTYRDQPSQVAPISGKPSKGPCKPAPAERPAREKRAVVETALAACRKRVPRLPLVAEDKVRSLLPADWPAGPLPQWVRLLAHFPRSGLSRVAMLRACEDKGLLDRRLRAQLAWISSRHDRAWYAVGHARKRLLGLGVKEDDIFALDGNWEKFGPGERAAFSLARKLTVSPQLITDDDIALLRKHYKDKEVAEIVHHITQAAFFNRLTEGAGLQLES
jgi:alkylhydroperoxidase family enzyme